MRAVTPRVLGLATLFNGAVASLVLVCTAVLIPEPATAQDTPRVEIGTSAGVTILKVSGSDAATNVGIPAGVGPELSPMMYATVFATPSVMVEPQIAFSRSSGGGLTLSSFSFAGQIGYLFTPSENGSPYVAVGGAFQWAKASASGFGDFSESGPGIGGEVGYRFTVRSSLAIRVDGRYRRWFSDFKRLNEIGFGVALGAVL